MTHPPLHRTLRIATRGSALARWQAEHVAGLIRAADPHVDVEMVVVSTLGDRRDDAPIWQIGGKGVFAKEVQAAVLEGWADIAVHSAKDLPSRTVEGLVLAAVPERGDHRDALVGSRFDDLPVGARIGTGSVRRRAQLAHARPDLTFGELRGNIATRLARARRFDAIVVAAAALQRLGFADRATEVLDAALLVPQVAQGALAVECRAGDTAADTETRRVLGAIQHEPSRRCVDAERGFLAELGGDCNLPAGAYAQAGGDGSLAIDAVLASLDGHVVVRQRFAAEEGEAPCQLGRRAARYLLDEAGGRALLAS